MNRRDFITYQAMLLSGLYNLNTFAQKRPDNLVNKNNTKVKTLIHLFMVGGPSQIELFDYKPELYKKDGKTIDNFVSEKGQVGGKIMKPITNFQQYGDSGHWFSDLLPNLAKHADDLTFIKSLTCRSLNHLLAQYELNTGHTTPGSPFVGAWIDYALEKNNSKLPNMAVMADVLGQPRSAPACWNSFLPGTSSKVVINEMRKTLDELQSFEFTDKKTVDMFMKGLKDLNQASSYAKHPVLKQREELFEFINRARTSLLDLITPGDYTEREQKLYGAKRFGENPLVDRLILARKLAEYEVPYVQICIGNEQNPTSWDHHFNIDHIVGMSKKIDRPLYGFLQDMKERELLDESLVLFAGEFGRTPITDDILEKGGKEVSDSTGRGHNNNANSIWLAGSGVKAGHSFGETDELSLHSVKDPITIGDLWATILHLMGIDHNKLIVEENGETKRLTTNSNRIIEQILS